MNGIELSRSTRLLIAANVVLALVVAGELLPTHRGTADAASSKVGTATLPDFGDTAIDAPAFGQLVDMMDRPIFFPDRRMPSPKVEQPPAPPPAPLRLKLEGIAIADGSRVAVLRSLEGDGLLQLGEGQAHKGWTLDQISSTAATFSRNGQQTTELPLDPAGASHRR